MAKNKMNMKYKSKKRERKNKVGVKETNETKNTIITIIVVVSFIALIYLGALGLEKLGVFEAGYTKPTTTTELSYTNILIGETFNRTESEYLVLFDTFDNNTNDVYVEYLTEQYTAMHVYKVDMSILPNSNFASESENKSASNSNELKINGITLIKIKNGRISDYITGSENISEYLK